LNGREEIHEKSKLCEKTLLAAGDLLRRRGGALRLQEHGRTFEFEIRTPHFGASYVRTPWNELAIEGPVGMWFLSS
jgi:hypothetical protein